MQLDAKTFLRLCEETHKIGFVDAEMSGKNPDYNSLIVVSILPYGSKVKSFVVSKVGRDREVVKAAVEEMNKLECWVTYYGKMFDIPFIQGRLLKHNLPVLVKKPHLDMYWLMRGNINNARRSQAFLLEWLDTPEKKMTVGADVWCSAPYEGESITTLKTRCESDVKGLKDLYDKGKRFVVDVKR